MILITGATETVELTSLQEYSASVSKMLFVGTRSASIDFHFGPFDDWCCLCPKFR